ncbi:MAG: 16S rRNA (cytosine(1402)-N(4))-methyltransferase RsmH [Planctomycetes bacterium]|nr:16S rRNA (cytosine(1402)-N(4))-methyltransferase RsmH [Planctomycetota bacterium]
MTAEHRPVLLEEAVGFLAPRPGGTYVDGTIGLGGHAERILELTEGRVRLFGIDRDEAALERARERLSRFGDAVTLARADFADLDRVLEGRVVDGILLDLGVSSLQLDDPSRGFSFRFDAPLDMRMSRTQSRTAADVLRESTEEQLEEIFRTCGEEPRARRIARGIGRTRGKGLETTRALAEFVERLVGRSGRIHPATRVFQALRIAVNGELESLKRFLGRFDKYLGSGGRAAIVSFHSLEDRLVKRAFQAGAREGRFRALTRKPVRPSREEATGNPRSRSAKLRAVEKA